MSILKISRKASEIAYKENFYEINTEAPLSSAFDIITNEQEIYRLTVLDSTRCVKGVLSGLRILEILSGHRGEAIKKSKDGKLKSVLREPVTLFVENYLHKLSSRISLEGLISYIVENTIGHVILVDKTDRLRGIVTEGCILKKLRVQDLPVKISDIMTSNVCSATMEHSIFDSINIMSTHNIRRLPIVDDSNIKGIVTVNDLLKHVYSNLPSIDNQKDDVLDELMKEPLKKVNFLQARSLYLNDDFEKILEDIKKSRFDGFPILDENDKLVGIISPRDLVTKLPKKIGIKNFVKAIE